MCTHHQVTRWGRRRPKPVLETKTVACFQSFLLTKDACEEERCRKKEGRSPTRAYYRYVRGLGSRRKWVMFGGGEKQPPKRSTPVVVYYCTIFFSFDACYITECPVGDQPGGVQTKRGGIREHILNRGMVKGEKHTMGILFCHKCELRNQTERGINAKEIQDDFFS